MSMKCRLKNRRKKREPVTLDFIKSNVDIDAKNCWVWCGSKDHNGYARVSFNGRNEKVVRVVLLLISEVPEGLHILHKCDRPPCCNPDHLFLGTNRDNMRDKCDKGRQFRAIGPLNGMCKLKAHQIKAIRNSKLSVLKLTKKFKVSDWTVRKIKTGEWWA